MHVPAPSSGRAASSRTRRGSRMVKEHVERCSVEAAMGLIVLVLNCGSSSVKFQVIEVERDGRDRRLARGIVERIGEGAAATFACDGAPPRREAVPADSHAGAVRRIVEWLSAEDGAGPLPARRIDVVGHRVVHGGERFRESVLIDAEVMRAIEALETLAPLHNAPSLRGIRAARATLGPGVPMVAAFDSAFHATLPEHAHRYAIPYELSLRHGIRRFGFHGTSFRAVLARYAELTGTPAARATVIALHLGNGCSAAAIRSGASIDTSMGYTPLEGLVMGTRCGDVDPSLIFHLARAEGIEVDEVEQLLNRRSGLLGVSGTTSDMRDLVARARRGEPRARLAIDLFCYRARKYIGAYLAALGGAEAVVFTGGIGEHSPEVRARICDGMAWCGLVLDPARNETVTEGPISPAQARLPAYVIPTDEELVIARDAARLITGAPAAT